MQIALGILTDAFAYGMVLFIISIGLSVTMGLMRVINLAHGAFAMIGGYFASYLTSSVGLGYEVALVTAVIGTILVAMPLEFLLYRRIYGTTDPLVHVLLTIGITFVVIGLANYAFGPTLKTITLPTYLQGSMDIGFRTLPKHRVFVIAAGLLVALALWYLVEKTEFGVRLRAAVDNAGMAAALGVRTDVIYAMSFALAVGLGAMGGIIGAELLPVEPYYGLRYMVTFLIVVSVGGAGSIPGSLLASLLLGIADTTGKYLFPEYGEFFFYLAVIGIVYMFPHGLLGRAH